VTNLSKDDAIDVLRKANLKWDVKNVNQAADKGQVVDQDPLPFKQVAPQSTVTIMVSTGKTKLPDVSGKTIDEATAYLQTHGFRNVDPTPRYQITTDQTQDGKVKATDPVKGTLVDPSEDRITLIVYKFQLPECSSTPGTSDSDSSGPSTGSSSTSGSAGPTTCTPPPNTSTDSTATD
jgi:serine/threonine-protein kinase